MTGSCKHLPPPALAGSLQSTASSFISEPHIKPASTLQSFEHPSLSKRLPSSQASFVPSGLVSTAPLPHAVAQACVFPEASRQLGSAVQVFEQPDASPKNRPFGPL